MFIIVIYFHDLKSLMSTCIPNSSHSTTILDWLSSNSALVLQKPRAKYILTEAHREFINRQLRRCDSYRNSTHAIKVRSDLF